MQLAVNRTIDLVRHGMKVDAAIEVVHKILWEHARISQCVSCGAIGRLNSPERFDGFCIDCRMSASDDLDQS